MKKTRIISLILVLSLIFGVLSVLPVSAEETESASIAVDILAQNVVYDEKVQIAYAVDVSLAEAENVTVEYYLEDNPETVYKAELLDVTKPNYVYNATNPVFATLGFHATDFTDVVYATAYIGDKAPENAVYKRYSVAEYFYSRLYKDDYINKTVDETDDATISETKPDFNRKKLYLSMVDYGRYAQEVIINDKGGNVTLITDYCYLWTAEDSITINGAKSALVAPGAAVTIAGADSYTATPVGCESTEITASYTAVAGVIAKIAAKTVEDTITVTDYESGAPYSNYVKTYDSKDVLVENTSWPASNPSTSYASLDIDPKAAANHVLHVRTTANGDNLTTKVSLSNTNQVGNCYTFETKMYAYAFASGTTYANIQFINSAGAASLDINIKALTVTDVANNSLAIYSNGTNYGGTKDTIFFDANNAVVKAGEWFTIRLEYYYAGGDSVSGTDATNAARAESFLKIYVNNLPVYEGNEYWQVTKDIKYVQINHEASGVAKNVAFDNIYFTQTDKTYQKTAE